MDANKAKESGVTPLVITRLNGNELAPRGSLVRVTCGTDRYASRERWFAVGIYFQKLAEAAVCSLPQIEPTDVVFARRPLKPAEIETLGLRRGQVVPCSVNDVEITFGIAVRDDTGATVESRSDESMLGRQRCGLIKGRPSAREDVEAGRTCPRLHSSPFQRQLFRHCCTENAGRAGRRVTHRRCT
jgi:hypothetical protein